MVLQTLIICLLQAIAPMLRVQEPTRARLQLARERLALLLGRVALVDPTFQALLAQLRSVVIYSKSSCTGTSSSHCASWRFRIGAGIEVQGVGEWSGVDVPSAGMYAKAWNGLYLLLTCTLTFRLPLLTLHQTVRVLQPLTPRIAPILPSPVHQLRAVEPLRGRGVGRGFAALGQLH